MNRASPCRSALIHTQPHSICPRYESNASFDLRNVHIYIPLPAGAQTPQVNQVGAPDLGL